VSRRRGIWLGRNPSASWIHSHGCCVHARICCGLVFLSCSCVTVWLSLLCYHHPPPHTHLFLTIQYSTRQTKPVEIKRTEHSSVLPAGYCSIVWFTFSAKTAAAGCKKLQRELSYDSKRAVILCS
jgi:hypothetical protein